MKILITGGEGFIARNLLEQLNTQYTIISAGRKELDLLESAEVFDFVKSNRFDVIVHAATYDAAPKTSSKDPLKVLENNLKMFFHLARCKDYFGKMIYFGSGAEFGREHWVPQMREDYFGRYVPTDQYGFSKYIMTRYAQLNGDIYNLRLFGVFGKYEDWRYRFISNVCASAVLNLPIRINQNVFFDYLYIDDLVGIVRWFIDNQPGHNVYNLCSGKVYDLKTLAQKIIRVSGKNLDVIIKTEGLGREYSGDNALMVDEIKDLEFRPMDESLKALYQWYDLNQNILQKDAIYEYL